MQTTDPDFAARVAAYEENRKRGVVFAADGTVGGNVAAAPRSAWRDGTVRRILRAAALLMFLKIALFHAGAMAGYNALATLVMSHASIVEKALALVFYPDPISVEASKYLRVGQLYLTVELRKIL